MNTAIPCRSNQCVFLATHSTRMITLVNGVDKRIQENDIWHMWFSSGGTLDGNIYTHSVSTRHIVLKCIPISDIYFPGKDTELDRETYLTCSFRSMLQDNGQTLNIYTPDSTSIDVLRASMTVEL
jgi:hypothetical protein